MEERKYRSRKVWPENPTKAFINEKRAGVNRAEERVLRAREELRRAEASYAERLSEYRDLLRFEEGVASCPG